MNTLKKASQCVLLFVMCLMLTQRCAAQSQTLDAKFDEYMSALARLGRFNGYVLIARDGQQIFGKGYGMANFEDDAPNTPQTKFRLASVTKPFTAAAVLLLQERGKLNLQDSICQHLKDCPPNWKPITVEQLMAHTSGIPDFAQLPGFMETLAQSSTTDEMIARFRDKPLLFAPGEKFSYSNSNYYLLGRIVENVSKKSYSAFIQENIFAPLKMMNSGYDDNRTILKRRAVGYIKQGDALINARYMDMSKAYAAGALYSTAEDMLLWDTALYTEQLLSKKSLEAMFKPNKGDAGYGWFIRRESGRLLIMQGGLNSGFAAGIFRYPEEKVCIILLNNLESAAQYIPGAGHDLAAILFGEKYDPPRSRTAIKVDPKIYDALVGEYDFGQNRIITITREGDKLFAQRTNGPKDEILPESETTFFLSSADVQLTFINDDAGKTSGMILRANGQEYIGKKTK